MAQTTIQSCSIEFNPKFGQNEDFTSSAIVATIVVHKCKEFALSISRGSKDLSAGFNAAVAAYSKQPLLNMQTELVLTLPKGGNGFREVVVWVGAVLVGKFTVNSEGRTKSLIMPESISDFSKMIVTIVSHEWICTGDAADDEEKGK